MKSTRRVLRLAAALVMTLTSGVVMRASSSVSNTQQSARRFYHFAPPWCVASALRASVDWQGVNTTRIGGITFAARGTTVCRLGGRPGIQVDGDGHALNVSEKPDCVVCNANDATVQTVTVYRRHQAGVAFDWANWCGAQFHSPLVLAVTLPRQGGRLRVYVRYGRVRRSITAPACLAPSQPSTIAVGFIRSVTPTNPLP